MVGGHHATIVPEDFYSSSVDVIVVGEGVFAFKQVAERFGRRKSFDGIAGVAFRNDDAYVKTEPSPVTDLDACPFPNRKLTKNYRKQYYSE